MFVNTFLKKSTYRISEKSFFETVFSAEAKNTVFIMQTYAC